jgi:hypothetical protein
MARSAWSDQRYSQPQLGWQVRKGWFVAFGFVRAHQSTNRRVSESSRRPLSVRAGACLAEFQAGHARSDDLTIMVLQRTNEGRERKTPFLSFGMLTILTRSLGSQASQQSIVRRASETSGRRFSVHLEWSEKVSFDCDSRKWLRLRNREDRRSTGRVHGRSAWVSAVLHRVKN